MPPAQPDPNLDGQDSTRFTAHDIELNPGDTLELVGIPDVRAELAPPAEPASAPGNGTAPNRHPPDLRELAPVDYIEIVPSSSITPQ